MTFPTATLGYPRIGKNRELKKPLKLFGVEKPMKQLSTDLATVDARKLGYPKTGRN